MGVIFLSCAVCRESHHEDDTAYCEECDKLICKWCATWDSNEDDEMVFEGGCPNCDTEKERDNIIKEIIDLSNEEQKDKIIELCNRLKRSY